MEKIKNFFIGFKNGINWANVFKITGVVNFSQLFGEITWERFVIINVCMVFLVFLAYLQRMAIGNISKNKEEKVIYEKNLNIYDIWEAPTGNLFIRVSEDYSIAIGAKGNHDPSDIWGTMDSTQYVSRNNITPVKKVGRLVFDNEGNNKRDKV